MHIRANPLLDACEKVYTSVGVTFPALPGRPLQLIDVQNLFCKVDKYARVAHPQFTGLEGRSRIKQRFQPAAAMLALCYPPKWEINAKLDGLLSGYTD